MKRLFVIALCGGLLGCSLGDGRGFATFDVTLTAEASPGNFANAEGKSISLTSVKAVLSHVELRAEEAVGGQLERRVTVLPAASEWPLSPASGVGALRFGPYEVDRGNYSEMALVFERVEVAGSIDGAPFDVVVTAEGGVAVTSPADLPVNRDRPPVVSVTASFRLPAAIFDGVDPEGDIAAQLVATIAAEGDLQATWIRRED